MVFAGLFPTDAGRLREPARRDGEAPPERRLVHVRAGELDGARLRLPLRLPRPPPHGDHPGAARARVRPRRSSRPRPASTTGSRRRRARSSRSSTRTTCPPPNYIERIEEPYITATIITRDEFLGGILKLCEERRGVQKSLEYLAAQPRRPDLRLPPERGRPRLLRQAEVASRAATPRSTTSSPATARATSSSSTSSSTASRSTPSP